jgi:hypothetical protein
MSIHKAMVFAVVLAGCSGGREPAGGRESPGADLGPLLQSFPQVYCDNYSVTNVLIDPVTYPWADPAHLLDSAEGCGPRTLDVTVASSIAPTWSVTGNYTPTSGDVSTALGYSVTATVLLSADSSVFVPVDAYARVSAYPVFQRATFQVVGVACPGRVVVGTGWAYRPVGIYFSTCGIIDTGPCGMSCPGGIPVPDPPDAGADGG